jgi:ribosome-binding factor A
MRGGAHDPELEGRPITVPEVRMSPDLKIATVYVMPLGGTDGERTIKALARSARTLRGALAKEIGQLKYMPELRFRLDTRFDHDDKVRELLEEPRVAADLATDAPGSAGTDTPEGRNG